MKKISTLSIGNSFSEDACAYLHQIAESAGINLECTNLYIGGCSLEAHAANLKSGEKKYELQINGVKTDKFVSIPEMLDSDFDIVTLQQASHFSGMPDTYYPYINELADAVRGAIPGAKLWIHETWAYEIDSTHGAFVNYHSSQREMYERMRDAYSMAACRINAPIIPVGDAIQYVRENAPEFDYKNGGVSLNRDGFHLSIPLGRCFAGYVWLETLCGVDAREALYVPDGMSEADTGLLVKLRGYAHDYVNNSK